LSKIPLARIQFFKKGVFYNYFKYEQDCTLTF
jgi:hypothetical protein